MGNKLDARHYTDLNPEITAKYKAMIEKYKLMIDQITGLRDAAVPTQTQQMLAKTMMIKFIALYHEYIEPVTQSEILIFEDMLRKIASEPFTSLFQLDDISTILGQYHRFAHLDYETRLYSYFSFFQLFQSLQINTPIQTNSLNIHISKIGGVNAIGGMILYLHFLKNDSTFLILGQKIIPAIISSQIKYYKDSGKNQSNGAIVEEPSEFVRRTILPIIKQYLSNIIKALYRTLPLFLSEITSINRHIERDVTKLLQPLASLESQNVSLTEDEKYLRLETLIKMYEEILSHLIGEA